MNTEEYSRTFIYLYLKYVNSCVGGYLFRNPMTSCLDFVIVNIKALKIILRKHTADKF